jgi:hypothetical protein
LKDNTGRSHQYLNFPQAQQAHLQGYHLSNILISKWNHPHRFRIFQYIQHKQRQTDIKEAPRHNAGALFAWDVWGVDFFAEPRSGGD